MRLSGEQLMAGFVHPSRVVRDSATEYFSDSYTRDAEVTRWAIRGVEQYGWKEFLFWQHKFCDLPLLNDDSFEWVCQQVERSDSEAPEENLKWHLITMLSKVDVDVLVRHQSRLMAIDAMRERERETIVRRIELAQADPEECWRLLEEHCQRVAKAESFEEARIPEATRLLEPIQRSGERFVPRVLEVLRRPQPDRAEQHPDEWLIGLMIILAGHLRIEEAAPLIWDKWGVDWDWYNEQVMYSLTRIGTPSVVEMARKRYPDSDWYVRNYAHNLFENIHGVESIEAIEAVLPDESDNYLRAQLGIAAAKQFDDRSAEWALSVWNENPTNAEFAEIRPHLVAFSHLSEWELPQRDQWEEEIQAAHDRIVTDDPSMDGLLAKLLQRLESVPASGSQPRLLLDPTRGPFTESDLVYEPLEPPMRRKVLVGRNDPCPCGSGKKYKKCCLNAAVRSQ